MKRIFLSFGLILLVNQIALAMEDYPREITQENLTPEKIAEMIATDGILDSEESYFRFLIDLVWRFAETKEEKKEKGKKKKKETKQEKEERRKKEDNEKKAKREFAFMSGIAHIRFYAIDPSYRRVMTNFANQIGDIATKHVECMFDKIPPNPNKNGNGRYSNLSENSTEELWFDGKIKSGASTKHVKLWRGYKITYEIKLGYDDQLSVLVRPENPIINKITRLEWQLGWSNGKVIFPLSFGNFEGYNFDETVSKEYVKKLRKGSRFLLKWGSVH